MTDEEKADKELAKTRSAEFTDERGIGYFSYYTGFLAGLKEGRQKWHKVADGDLPKENVKLVLVRDSWKNRFLNYHLLWEGMICEMIDQFDEWLELPIEE